MFVILVILALLSFSISALPRLAAKFPAVNFDGAGKALLVGAYILH